jgi:hypothetical protein
MANEYLKISLVTLMGHHSSLEQWEAAKPPTVHGGASGKAVILGLPAESPRAAVEVRVDDAGNLYLGPAK